MNITEKWLGEKCACLDGVKWFKAEKERGAIKVIQKLMIENRFPWANWLIVRVMARKQYLAYAIFAAEQVIDIYEKKYPNNKMPRQAIEAAKAVLENDTPPTPPEKLCNHAL